MSIYWVGLLVPLWLLVIGLSRNSLMVGGFHQSGFRAIHSTVAALLEATDSWDYNIDIGNINGISRNSLKWFQSYLENRTQQCSVFGSLSDSSVLTCCVPQGTILGPLLLFLYILNDLPNCLSDCEPRMYADDMQTYSKCD